VVATPSRLVARRGVVVLAVVLLAWTAVGCSKDTSPKLSDDTTGGPASIDISTTTDPLADVDPAGGPAVGICRPTLTVAERRAAFERRPAVRCTVRHGGEVVATYGIPKATAAKLSPELIKAGGAAFEKVMGQTGATCNAPANDAIQQIIDIDLEGTPFSAAFQATNLGGSYFVPSPDEWLAGERWLVCEVTAVSPDGTSVPYVGPLDQLGRGTLLPTELGACVDEKLAFVVCEGDASRAVASGNVSGESAPDDDTALAGCRTLADRLGAKVTDARPLKTKISQVEPGTFAVFCLLPGPAPIPRG